MNFQPDFRVHVADPMGFADQPVIITAVYTDHAGYPKGEWFLIVPDDDKSLFARQTRLKFREFPSGPVSFDEEFIFNEVLSQAKLRLRQYIIETKGGEAFSLLSKRLDELTSNQNLLVNLWMRGDYSECLNRIHGKTGCKKLTEFLDWLISLPIFTNEKL